MRRRTAWLRAGLVMLVVAAIDQGTKALALASLDADDDINVFFGINLSLVRNTGVAFGALSGAGDLPVLALTGGALALLIVFFATRATRPWLWLPVGVVVGGAAGNLIDRARLGAVTDFIDPAFWPAFNVADIAVVLGVFGVLYVSEGGGDPDEAEAGDAEEGHEARA